MVSHQEKNFSVSRKALLIKWGLLLLLFASTIVIPFLITVDGQAYPDLSVAPIVCAGVGFIWVPLLAEYWRQTTYVGLSDKHCIVKKLIQTPRRFDYEAILTHNERLEVDKGDKFNVLTVYLQDDFFIIKSNEFADYELLKDQLSQYGKSVTYHKVMTLAERNRLRWMIGGLVLLIIANIAFGYVAHNPSDPNPARLVTITGLVDKVNEDRPKGGLKGVRILLRTYPDLFFYISRRDYDIRLDTLKWAIATRRPIELRIRESDYRKKLIKTEPLTFGDKYVNYKQILVFGVRQGDSVRINTSKPVYEPTHTNPGQRSFLLSILLLLCWTGWAYVDRYKVLRAN